MASASRQMRDLDARIDPAPVHICNFTDSTPDMRRKGTQFP